MRLRARLFARRSLSKSRTAMRRMVGVAVYAKEHCLLLVSSIVIVWSNCGLIFKINYVSGVRLQ